MKKILMLIMAIAVMFMVTGCVTDGAYGAAKVVYKDGKEVVKVSGLKSQKLSNIDTVVSSYDKVRTAVRTEIDDKE